MTARAGTRARPHPPAVPPSRYRRRRLAAVLVAVLLVVGLGLSARVALYDLGLADVEAVRVTGASTVSIVDVQAAAVAPGGPLAEVDVAAVAGRVARLPAVESVRVGRSWPHTVAVEVTERVPVAVTPTAAGSALVDRAGVVYLGRDVPGLPQLHVAAPGPRDPATLVGVAVLGALPPPLCTQVVAVDVTVAAAGAPGQVVLGLTNDRLVRWGDPDRAQLKAAVLAAVLTRPGHIYDVSSPELPTVRQ